jgi:hypothetical protein
MWLDVGDAGNEVKGDSVVSKPCEIVVGSKSV